MGRNMQKYEAIEARSTLGLADEYLPEFFSLEHHSAGRDGLDEFAELFEIAVEFIGTRRRSCWTGESTTCSNAKSRAFMSALSPRAIFAHSRQPIILPGCIPFRASSGDRPHCCCLRSVEGGYMPPAPRSRDYPTFSRAD